MKKRFFEPRLIAVSIFVSLSLLPLWANANPITICESALESTDESQNFNSAFLGTPVLVDSEIGLLSIGIIDVDYPGVAQKISEILVQSISDAKQSNHRPGHLPDHLVEDVIKQYISPEKVKSLWRYHAHRFAALNTKGEIVGTLLLGKDQETILYLNRWNNNVSTQQFPEIKPQGYHQMMNLSVPHHLRRSKIASILLGSVCRHFRHLFNGRGIWMRADPPWHDKLVGLGFQHDLSKDSFLSFEAERTLGMPHHRYNDQYRCTCGLSSSSREHKMNNLKLQYLSFTRDFEPIIISQTKKTSKKIDVLIVGAGIAGTSFALKLKELNPNLKTLMIAPSSSFALSGQGHLYPMTNMDGFRFPGIASIQPTLIDGKTYPGEVERALRSNLESLNVWYGETISHIHSNKNVVLSSGIELQAEVIVVATGMSPVITGVVDANAKKRIKDFLTLNREIAELPFIHSQPGQWGIVAILGDGAAGNVLVRKLKQDPYQVAEKVLFIGETASGEKVEKVSFDDGRFEIVARSLNGNLSRYHADRVVTAFGFESSEGRLLAKKLNTNWVVGAAAFSEIIPPIVDQVEHLSRKALALHLKLTKETR